MRQTSSSLLRRFNAAELTQQHEYAYFEENEFVNSSHWTSCEGWMASKEEELNWGDEVNADPRSSRQSNIHILMNFPASNIHGIRYKNGEMIIYVKSNVFHNFFIKLIATVFCSFVFVCAKICIRVKQIWNIVSVFSEGMGVYVENMISHKSIIQR